MLELHTYLRISLIKAFLEGGHQCCTACRNSRFFLSALYCQILSKNDGLEFRASWLPRQTCLQGQELSTSMPMPYLCLSLRIICRSSEATAWSISGTRRHSGRAWTCSRPRWWWSLRGVSTLQHSPLKYLARLPTAHLDEVSRRRQCRNRQHHTCSPSVLS